MNKVESTLPELLSLLTTVEGAVKKNRTQALLISGSSKAKGKRKFVATNKLKPKANPIRRRVRARRNLKALLYASIVKRKDIGRGTTH